ncbi:hypothetical protein FA04_23815 (plasmid) [Ensifer adhaerens]|jgi:hypothetical protein|nr:hypothetical protein FA04_23815 [Ensifer adhaerens]KDP73504.1 hypothetical protein FA04_11270 [Ensifer adhaerens]SFH25478.1 hypothetical protein SAMN05216459_1222 [Ensifer sp. OV372]
MFTSVTLFAIHGINPAPWKDKLFPVFELRQTVECLNATDVKEGPKSINSFIIATCSDVLDVTVQCPGVHLLDCLGPLSKRSIGR